MSIKYICILAFISVLETQIESRVDIQNEKNIISLRSLDNHKRINMKLPKEHKTAIHVDELHKKPAKYNPSQLRPNHHKQLLELPPFFKDITYERQLKKPSKVYPVYSDYQKDEKKGYKKSGSSAVNMKLPKNGIKNSKISKKIPNRSKKAKAKKIHQKFEKESPKDHKHLLKQDKNVSKITNTPSIYLKPPEIGQKSFYNAHRRRTSSKRFKKPSHSVTDYIKGEENRQEKQQHYVRDHEPIHQKRDESNEKNKSSNDSSQEELSQEINESLDNGNRVDFHIHGQDGPESYVFGFDTGDGENRQFRWEQRHVNGTVTGQYGYYDPRGKFKKIFYRSDPHLGYQQNELNDNHDAQNLIENEGK
ncbi:uncharacterized protein [Chelonus insularis]|uniref:uncharacterized protein n=1 Tax=Chelonus insularis TaxID=460826 RepID=UPI00158F5995|nr:uncharacterized protein LOC118066798 [Chelonus insularis]